VLENSNRGTFLKVFKPTNSCSKSGFSNKQLFKQLQTALNSHISSIKKNQEKITKITKKSIKKDIKTSKSKSFLAKPTTNR
jgi:hypothetical protein